MKVLHLDTNHPLLLNTLKELGCENVENYKDSKATILKTINEYDGIIIRSRFSIDKEFLDAAENLKFIGRVGAGLENIDVDYAKSKGIELISAPEGNRNAVGEHALAMILALFNNLKKADLEIRNGQWLREENRGVELDGKTVGIIGYGNMGRAFAKKLRGFDVEVLCYDIKPNVGDMNCRQVSLEELFAKTDVLSLHTPHNELSNQMIDEKFIYKFKKPFYLINTARGSAVVTKDLIEAIDEEKILGACLDVLEYEKSSFENFFESSNSENPYFRELISSDKVLLSPHVAGWTIESKEKLAQTIVDKVENIFFHKKNAIEKIETNIKGIGGIFFKADNPVQLKEWYKEKLGIAVDEYGASFISRDINNPDKKTFLQWSTFPKETDYFKPSLKDFMINYRVNNLNSFLEELKSKDVTIIKGIEEYEYGKFAWILDSENNKIELWEPIDEYLL